MLAVVRRALNKGEPRFYDKAFHTAVRLLHLIQRYWPVRGGAEIHLQAIGERLARDGHSVTVATTDVRDIAGFAQRQLGLTELYRDNDFIVFSIARDVNASSNTADVSDGCQ